MKTILVLAPQPELAEALRAGLKAEEYRIIHRIGVTEAEPFLAHGLAQAVVVDAELEEVQSVWMIERLRRQNAHCPILVYTHARSADWEEEAYLRGATHVLPKPLRLRVLQSLLAGDLSPIAAAPSLPAPQLPMAAGATGMSGVAPMQSLAALRNFSSVLTHSLNAEGLVRQFLLQLREIISLNRAIIFLRPVETDSALGVHAATFRSFGAIGLTPGLLEHCELSVEAGIGGQLFRLGRIVRRHSEEVRADAAALREFDMLGGQVAIPIFDRHSLLGLAVLDGRITGESFTNSELELVFHLLEQLGLAIRNIRLHDQLSASHAMMTSVLRELNSACVVLNRDLRVLHANKMARKLFGSGTGSKAELEFADLPQVLGAKAYQVLRSGAGLAPFQYQPEEAPGTVYQVNLVPLQAADAEGGAVLLVVDDHTQREQLQRLEVEAANLRLIKSMADRLAHEVGNAMVPLSTHQQLLVEKYRDPEFRASLDQALAEGVKRVNRLINQMRYLARDSITTPEPVAINSLIEDAYQEARKYHPGKAAQLKFDHAGAPVVVQGDRAALRYALTELLLNALQANPTDPKIGVRLEAGLNGGGKPGLHIEIQDNGAGFTPEALQKGVAPFYGTRNVGLGLGLTVTQKILETHHGRLELMPPANGGKGVVRVSLPLENLAPSKV